MWNFIFNVKTHSKFLAFPMGSQQAKHFFHICLKCQTIFDIFTIQPICLIWLFLEVFLAYSSGTNKHWSIQKRKQFWISQNQETSYDFNKILFRLISSHRVKNRICTKGDWWLLCHMLTSKVLKIADYMSFHQSQWQGHYVWQLHLVGMLGGNV